MSLEYRNEDGDQQIEDAAPPEHFRIPVPYYTLILLLCIAAVMAVQLYVGLDSEAAFAAAFDKPAFFKGEYWRIITGATLHGFILHAVMNGYALYSFGRLFELLTNRAHLAIVFLLSVVGGGLLSAFFIPEGTSVGASGGIVGLIGYLLIYAFRRRQFISAEFRKSLILNIGFILIFGLVLYQIVDNFGHIGGLVTGAVYGLIQIPSNAYENPQNAGKVIKLFGVGSLATYIVASVFSICLMLSRNSI